MIMFSQDYDRLKIIAHARTVHVEFIDGGILAAEREDAADYLQCCIMNNKLLLQQRSYF